jgi:uncharacterized protein YycO
MISKVYSYTFNGISLRSGDIICTYDGGDTFVSGQFWWLIGKIIPGDVDHIVIYVGPNGRCVESNGNGVTVFEMSETWDANKVKDLRGGLLDNYYGTVYPLKDAPQDTVQNRIAISNYCLEQAQKQKKYNLNIFNSETEDSFYCSQLAYKAYQKVGINLNTGIGVPNVFGTEKIVFPQEIWEGFYQIKG